MTGFEVDRESLHLSGRELRDGALALITSGELASSCYDAGHGCAADLADAVTQLVRQASRSTFSVASTGFAAGEADTASASTYTSSDDNSGAQGRTLLDALNHPQPPGAGSAGGGPVWQKQ